MNNNEIIKDQYRLIKEIGKGSFGNVYLVEDIKNAKNKFALKRIQSNKLNESEYLLKAFKLELEVMKKCECENSVQLIEFFQTTHFHNMIMELCDGDLDTILKTKETGFSEQELKGILLQLNNVFKIMNKENIIHRDLKLKNILYTSNIKTTELLDRGLNLSDEFNENSIQIKKDDITIKLTDFGFSKVLDEDITSTKLGTPATMAPEIMMNVNKGYTNKVDLWSIGVISYQLLFKRLPFTGYNEQDLLNNIKTKSLSFPSTKKLSDQCKELMTKLLQINPDQRLNWKEYYDHPFFMNENDEDNIDKLYSNFRKLSDDSETPIHKARHIKTGEHVFIKIVEKKKLESNKNFKQIFLKECELLKSFHNENAVKLIEICESPKNYYIITESFEGKRLDNFLKNRLTLSESFIRKILRQILPMIKEIDALDKTLEFISPQSFWFKNFVNEDNFCIKFYDYGISSIYSEKNYQRSYLLTEAVPGCIKSQKTNILSIGLIIYLMLFGENLYQFSENEDPEETIKKSKYFYYLEKINKIKVPKQISNQMKNLLACTMNFNIEKRYDWKKFIEDQFIKIQYCEDIRTYPFNHLESTNRINDYQIETLAENIINKVHSIYNYYYNLLKNEKNSLEKIKFHKFSKEINTFILITVNQSRTFRNNIIKKNQMDSVNSQIFFVKVHKNDYKFSNFNFNSKLSNLIINFENPVLENFDKRMKSLEDDLISLTYSKKEIDNFSDFETFSTYRNGDSVANIEKYFFKLLENAILSFSKEDYSLSLDEVLISKFLIENIILLRFLICSIEPNELTSEIFCKILQEYSIEESSFIFDDKKNDNTVLSQDYITFFAFLGEEIKGYIKKKLIFIENNEKIKEEFNLQYLTKFYMDIIKMKIECEKRINQYK